MKRLLPALVIILAASTPAAAQGLLIPHDRTLPPLAMVNHRVNVVLEDQVAVTKVEQTFRNHTARPLEATYVFPVPKGASVREFAMWVGGKLVKGELLEAAKAKQIYTDIVRRTQDPGLLEYIGSDLLRLQVFPVPPSGDQKLELSYTSIANREGDLFGYTYPMKTDGKVNGTLEDFTLKLTLKSQHPVLNIYSPTHAISIQRNGDKEAVVGFEKLQALLDKDFQLFYTLSSRDVGLTALFHRAKEVEDGYFLFLLSPRAELAQEQRTPRDMVFVLDTSGSMLDNGKINQARKALQRCLDGLSPNDRFAVLNFSTTVNRFETGLMQVSKEKTDQAKQWVDKLEAAGGTAINDALLAALDLQTKEEGRTFTLVFFTDGQPTVGVTHPPQILSNVKTKNTASTRIFSFGVGYDVNATLLDQLAEQTRASSTYVRPEEDMEVKVSSFFGKISHPVMTNLKLTAGGNIRLSEIYPPELPDLFHGGQLIVAGRYSGVGHTTLTLDGKVGKDSRNFVYELDFPGKSESKSFVEDLWARRKVGYLLDQIRANGEKKELVEEVTKLAKKHGIATPYTSYLVVPDAPIQVAAPGRGRTNMSVSVPLGLTPREGEKRPVLRFAQDAGRKPGGATLNRAEIQDEALDFALTNKRLDADGARRAKSAKEANSALKVANEALRQNQLSRVQTSKLGVELSVQSNTLKDQIRVQQTAQRRVGSRNVLEVGGVWIDEGFDSKMKTIVVKAQSDAYFRILDRQPQVREVLQLGNHLVWVTPNNTALVIDTQEGKEKLTDQEIDSLFVASR